MIGQHREKQFDGAHPGEALLLHMPENGDPPRWQEVVSCAEAKHYAVPSFFEECRHCGRDECDSYGGSDPGLSLRGVQDVVLMPMMQYMNQYVTVPLMHFTPGGGRTELHPVSVTPPYNNACCARIT
jgi:hypothetical protein